MFTLADHLVHLDGDALPREVDARTLRDLLARDTGFRVPVPGAVYGVLLNDRAALEALGGEMAEAPYRAPPQAPILYLKPRNTHAGHRSCITMPEDTDGIEVGASLGIVIGRTATRLSLENALDHVAGYTAVADLSIPHTSLYRPSVRFRARDRFCVIGPALVAKQHVPDPDRLAIRIDIAGRAAFEATTATAVRGVARLLVDVTDFMTLAPGDILTLGVPHGAPVARAGDDASIAIGEFAPLRVSFARIHSLPGAMQ
ncbi:fumarylacetoacetate hydrolase family protein [Trinickia diaoshuihuensis]|jgi:5-oxopent-3-ene-1,2,5-tricarboxylate decarboxylase/2-hydroxyhepta-2,4-diene-1,7-dioate isomerase|uniref:fumarylacetoacetate hydrolase family protein n=1 Tax=Trinickia diaoshuihuensis TaxID=2292265 RepID=UPI000E268F23|nr:fumarylacetoacetate hydrolase family protein [Trinickia diaoshuihuensis]